MTQPQPASAGAKDIKATKGAEDGGGGGGGVKGGGSGFGSAGARRAVEAATSITYRSMSDPVVPPAHDVDLSELLSKLLRHKAVELGVAIDADG